MKLSRQGRPRRLALLTGLAGVSALIVASVGAGGAGAAGAPTPQSGVVTMEQDGNALIFNAPETVEQGAQLKVKNLTSPRQVGPHTFSLVKQDTLPGSGQQIRRCAQNRKICRAIGEWHQFDPDTGEVEKNPVKVGERGWDREGSLQRKGDSWVSEERNESFEQKVSARVGKTLHFICAIHPDMQGQVEVVEGT